MFTTFHYPYQVFVCIDNISQSLPNIHPCSQNFTVLINKHVFIINIFNIYDSEIQNFLVKMRDHMPKVHKEFIETIAEKSNIRNYGK
jgi:hypothetical protein